MKSLSSADANRNFSAVLREVSQGEEILVISRGKPVAKITKVDVKEKTRAAAKNTLLQRLQSQAISGSRNWSRAELYE
jgi:prevent-host-death family protein